MDGPTRLIEALTLNSHNLFPVCFSNAKITPDFIVFVGTVGFAVDIFDFDFIFTYILKYEKEKEDHRISRLMTFTDRFGKEIPNVLDWDSTGIATVLEHRDLNNPRSPMIEKRKFFPCEFRAGFSVGSIDLMRNSFRRSD